MNAGYWIVTNTIRRLTRVLCEVDDGELVKIPQRGPLILVSNHINFLEVPLLFTHLQPRPITGFAKAESWDSRWMGALFNLWGGIPLRRGEADMTAVRKGLAALEQGKILGISPEGTRSGDGCLQRGHPGIVTLALRAGGLLGRPVPILPVAFWGNERLYANLGRLRRTPFHIRVGNPFTLGWGKQRVSRETRQDIVDEIMLQLAGLLPDENRGYYARAGRLELAKYLRFEASPLV